MRASARIVVLISGRGSNLQAIAAACADGRLKAGIVGVVSNRPQAAGLEWARAQGLVAASIDHTAYGDRAGFDGALADRVASLDPDWIVLAGFMRILGPTFVDRFDGRIVNIHPSLLPAYPGLHTHRQAIADGAMLHGASVHLVTARLDHGPILAQAVVPVLPSDDEAALAARVLQLEHALYVRALGWLVEGRVTVADGRATLDGLAASAERLLLHPLLVPPAGDVGS
ncbi:MAG: phosphoribosylglycinamide formyltransferase [Lautropia sp.]